MPGWVTTALSLLLSLTVTFIFNKAIAWPQEVKKRRAAEAAAQREREEAERLWKEQQMRENAARDARINALQAVVDNLPAYRAQSLQIQAQLQGADREILCVLAEIKGGIKENQDILNTRLDRLEDREKNAIRAKLIDEYRLFTDEAKNPMLAWSEMEHHAFFALVSDYEDLCGNDYVHNTVLPAMNELRVIKMSDRQELLKLMNSRKL